MFLAFFLFEFEKYNFKNCRFQKTLLTSWHNHMRVTRLLAHFSVTGFRRYAEKLIEFLETEIYG